MTCGACEETATQSWQRWATEAEVAELHQSGDLPGHETTAQLMVYGCDEHALDLELAALTHGSMCAAPPTCDCGVQGGGGVGG